MKPRVKAIVVLSAVFLLGGVAGAGASRAYMLQQMRARFGGPPGEVRAHLRVEAMRRQLDLTPEQVERIEAIFREADTELERAMKPCHEELEALRKRNDERIAEVLDASQRTRFQEFASRHRHRHGPFPPPPPPPPPEPR